MDSKWKPNECADKIINKETEMICIKYKGEDIWIASAKWIKVIDKEKDNRTTELKEKEKDIVELKRKLDLAEKQIELYKEGK